MLIDTWFPIGFTACEGKQTRLVLYDGGDWQIYEALGGGRILIAKEKLANRWVEMRLIESNQMHQFCFGSVQYFALYSPEGQTLCPISSCVSPQNKNEALSFIESFRATRGINLKVSLHDSLYAEKISRLLPIFGLSPTVEDDVVLGSWLTGGVPVSVRTHRRLSSLLTWLSEGDLQDLLRKADFVFEHRSDVSSSSKNELTEQSKRKFVLAGRPYLEDFFCEHVIDIIQNAERYKLLGIDFPSAIVLHGPPGCGKTFAVQKLIEYLEWPSVEIDSTSIGSPYIHETGRKIAEVFDKAINNSPSVLVIDEMESFLADRQIGSGSSHHRVEEVAEFLRRIPEALKNRVLIIAMTNRIDMIDPAILRRGRFDHIISVDMPSENEVHSLLQSLVGELPHDQDIDLEDMSERLKGRPLSDIAFVVREGARIAARAGNESLDRLSLDKAIKAAGIRSEQKQEPKTIGFLREIPKRKD